MSNYSKDKQQEHLGMVKKMMARYPGASALKIREALEKVYQKFDYDYILKLHNKIIKERAVRYDRAAKNEAIAKFEDFINDMGDELNRIIASPENQKAKIMAIKQKVEDYKALLDLQFDMGVFERELGKIKNEVINVAEIIKLIKDVQSESNKNNKQIT